MFCQIFIHDPIAGSKEREHVLDKVALVRAHVTVPVGEVLA
jgi:hypothetical protein